MINAPTALQGFQIFLPSFEGLAPYPCTNLHGDGSSSPQFFINDPTAG
jgi:hypothetical protein